MNITPELLTKCTDGTMNIGPKVSEDSINSVCEITGIDRSQAIIVLNKWPNLESAIQHYFDNPSQAVADEAAARRWEPQDNVPYAGAVDMSRPPSRNEATAGSCVDLSDLHAEASAQIKSDDEYEHAQMQKAMEESMKDMSHQESGITPAGQHFGPANRRDYKPEEWALARIATAREVVDHPPPAKRRRINDQPPFLRGAPDTGYLAPLLNIYHSIPLAREALLFPGFQPYSYGHDSSWWSGTTDENNKGLAVELSDNDNKDQRNLVAEIQCLMAFLDSTGRAYGSVDALADLRAYRNITAEEAHTRLLEAWNVAAMGEKADEPLTQVFTSVAMQATGPEVFGPEAKHLFCLDGVIDQRRSETLTEILDRVVWDDSPDHPLQDVWIEQVGEIFTIRFYEMEKRKPGLDIEAAEVWYPDRYMFHLREAVMEIRRRRMRLFQEIERLRKVALRITEMPLPGGAKRNIRETLQAAANLATVAQGDTIHGLDLDDDEAFHIDVGKLKDDMTKLLERLDSKLSQIQAQRAHLYELTRQATSDLTMPSANSSAPLRHRYTLQGVTTKPNVTYVRRKNQDLLGLHADSALEPPDEYQWWRMAWDEGTSNQHPVVGPLTQTQAEAHKNNPDTEIDSANSSIFSIRRVTIEEVFEAVRSEHHTAIFVYASEAAMNRRPVAITPSLKQFVEQDNRAFLEELGEHSAASRTRSRSMDTGNAVDYEEMNLFSDTIEVEQQELREMTPMSMRTIRGSDGPPSPKRPRSSDDSTPDASMADDPPSYEAGDGGETQQMQEKKGGKIGYYAERMMDQLEGKGNVSHMDGK